MLCIDSRNTDIYFNLAAEEYVLKQRTDSLFMLWQSTPAVVIGKHQSLRAEVDLMLAQKENINLARRFSGGGAVYQDAGNVNLTFIETVPSATFGKYLAQTLDFLASIGVNACADERLGIHIDGSKISGSAQCIHRNRVMYHCTLLYTTDLQLLTSSLQGNFEKDAEPGYAVKSVKSEVTNISEQLSVPPNIAGFKRDILSFFVNRAPENKLYNWNRDEIMAIEELKKEKYARKEWIFSKSILKEVGC